MKRSQMAEIMGILSVEYQAQFEKLGKQGKEAKLNLWYTVFESCDFELFLKAVTNFMMTDKKGFIPKIGEINEWIYTLTSDEEVSEQEAVTIVMNSLSNAYYEPKSAFESLPAILQKVVGTQNQLKQWSMMDISTVQSVVASNISRSYRDIVRREKEKKIIDPEKYLKLGQQERKQLG